MTRLADRRCRWPSAPCSSLPPSALAAWTWPLQGEVVTAFRNGDDPYAAGQHRGIDIAGRRRRARRGRGARARALRGHRRDRRASTVSVRSDDGRFDVSYLHLASIAVRRGAAGRGRRRRSAPWASPASARPSAPHLHFGVRAAGTRHAYVDPLTLLPPPRRARAAPAPRRARGGAGPGAPGPGARTRAPRLRVPVRRASPLPARAAPAARARPHARARGRRSPAAGGSAPMARARPAGPPAARRGRRPRAARRPDLGAAPSAGHSAPAPDGARRPSPGAAVPTSAGSRPAPDSWALLSRSRRGDPSAGSAARRRASARGAPARARGTGLRGTRQ